jgi:hypothetical protein
VLKVAETMQTPKTSQTLDTHRTMASPLIYSKGAVNAITFSKPRYCLQDSDEAGEGQPLRLGRK